jgi:anaerobic ribonucleoside-triphosphate reductase activating protein
VTVPLNIAAVCPATRALGPGLRAAVWVQGCPFDCPGCIAPDWIPTRPARAVSPDELARELCAGPVTGLTLSGGEPMSQAPGLAQLIDEARGLRALSIICFTGYRLERLRRDPPGPGVAGLLSRVDVLIDGRYVAALDNGRGLRGSTNQRVHQLTDRLRHTGFDFEHGPRRTEIVVGPTQARLVGVPTAAARTAFDVATRPRQPPDLTVPSIGGAE